MKSLDGQGKSAAKSGEAAQEAAPAAPAGEEKIDFSNVVIEPMCE